MTYTRSSPIRGTSNITGDQLFAAFLPMIPPGQLANAKKACDAIVIYAAATGLDPLVVASIVWIETGAPGTGLPFRSPWYLAGFNMGNLGITGDDDQNVAAQTWSTLGDGVLATVAHLVGYSSGKSWRAVWDVDALGDPTVIDKRFNLAIANTPNSAGVKTLADLNRRWAIDADDDYGGKLADRANQLIAAIKDPPVTTPSTPAESGEQENPVTFEIRNMVIGVQANAPATKLNAAAGRVRPIVHNTDNPSTGADAVMHAQFVANGGGSGNVSFHFANDSKRAVQILPLDRIGYHASDGCDNRSTDVGCFDGIAVENCDNVDGNIDQTFDNLAELLACIEFGDDRIDYGTMPKSYFAGFIDRTLGHHDVAYDAKWCPSDFMNRYGETAYKTKLKALAKAKLAAKQGTTPAETADDEPTTTPVYATPDKPRAGTWATKGGTVFIGVDEQLKLAQSVTPRKYAEHTQPATGPDLTAGSTVTVTHIVVASDNRPWLIIADGSRIPASALVAA